MTHAKHFQLVLSIVLTAMLLTGCRRLAGEQPGEAVTLTVMAAASLQAPFEELGAQFEAQHANVTVAFNFAASQQLAHQLRQGAPADVFASANQKQMDAMIESGRIAAGAAQIFTQNALVVIVPVENPGGLNRLADLARSGYKLVLADEAVPVGGYTLAFLDKASAGEFGSAYKAQVLANVVSYEENVKSVLAKVALGEADAGIVYSSDVTGDDAAKVTRIAIPAALNVAAQYPIALVADSKNTTLAGAFVELVLGESGQAVLAKYGFVPVGE